MTRARLDRGAGGTDAFAGVCVGGVLGCLVGGWLALAHATGLLEPDALDPARWTVVRPGMDERISDQKGRGAARVAGELVLVPHVFSRADVLVPRDPRPVASVDLALAPGSGPLVLRLREGGKVQMLTLGADAWSTAPGTSTPHTGPYALAVHDGAAWLDGRSVGSAVAPTLEVSAGSAAVHVRRLVARAADGSTIVDEPGPDGQEAERGLVGGVLGLVAGGMLGATRKSGERAVRRRPLAGLAAVLAPLALLIPPAAVCLVSADAWLALVERLYLVKTSPWVLARLAFALAWLPAAIRLGAATGRAVPGDEGENGRIRPVWIAVATLTAIVATKEYTPASLAVAAVGLAFLVAPLAFARAARTDPGGTFVRDLPALASVAALGWGVGGLVALVYRLALLSAGAGVLVRRAPRAAADALFGGFLLLAPAAELAARSTWLDEAWDAARLSGGESWRDPAPFWEASCGNSPRGIVYLGGSSTGGAYQFLGEPEAFFAGRVHARLCAQGLAVRTSNFGSGGRDSFTASRSAAAILASTHPSVVVAYLGVNDLLTQESPLTRAQREALEAQRSAAARGLAAMAAHSRLVTGLALLTRPALDPDAPVVSDVPLADAEENLRRLAAAVVGAGARLLLLPEQADAETTRRLGGYAEMEARVAAENPGVRYLDLGAALGDASALLVDRNHLSREGSERVAEVLAPVVAEMVAGGEGASGASR